MVRFTLTDLLKNFLPAKKPEPTKEIEKPGVVLAEEDLEDEQEEEISASNDEEEQELTENDIETVDLLPQADPPKTTKEFKWVDFRKTKRTKSRGNAHGVRKWTTCNTIMIHQTATPMKAKTFLNIPVHGGVDSNGIIVNLHDPTYVLWHGNSGNSFSIGIEVACRAAGIEGNMDTLWMHPDFKKKGLKPKDVVREATDYQIEAAKELCRYYINLVKENGGEIKYIMPHRLATNTRTSDCGSRLWKKIAIEIMNEFNLKVHPVVGKGEKLPQAWDEINGKGIPYSKEVKGF